MADRPTTRRAFLRGSASSALAAAAASAVERAQPRTVKIGMPTTSAVLWPTCARTSASAPSSPSRPSTLLAASSRWATPAPLVAAIETKADVARSEADRLINNGAQILTGGVSLRPWPRCPARAAAAGAVHHRHLRRRRANRERRQVGAGAAAEGPVRLPHLPGQRHLRQARDLQRRRRQSQHEHGHAPDPGAEGPGGLAPGRRRAALRVPATPGLATPGRGTARSPRGVSSSPGTAGGSDADPVEAREQHLARGHPAGLGHVPHPADVHVDLARAARLRVPRGERGGALDHRSAAARRGARGSGSRRGCPRCRRRRGARGRPDPRRRRSAGRSPHRPCRRGSRSLPRARSGMVVPGWPRQRPPRAARYASEPSTICA